MVLPPVPFQMFSFKDVVRPFDIFRTTEDACELSRRTYAALFDDIRDFRRSIKGVSPSDCMKGRGLTPSGRESDGNSTSFRGFIAAANKDGGINQSRRINGFTMARKMHKFGDKFIESKSHVIKSRKRKSDSG